MIKVALIMSSIISLMCMGCKHNDIKPNELNSWFEVQKQYANSLNKAAGGDPTYKVIPVVGPIYEIGVPLRVGTVSPITNDCKIDPRLLIETSYGSLPVTKQNKTFSLKFGMSETLKAALSDAVSAGIDIKQGKSLELNYFNLKQSIVSEADTENALSEEKCMKALIGKKVAFIRGVIKGRMVVTSKNGLDIDPTLNVTQIGDFSFKYDDNGDFSLDEKNVDAVRFFIVSEFEMTSKTVTEAVSAGVGPDWTPEDGVPQPTTKVYEKPVIDFVSPSEKTVEAILKQ